MNYYGWDDLQANSPKQYFIGNKVPSGNSNLAIRQGTSKYEVLPESCAPGCFRRQTVACHKVDHFDFQCVAIINMNDQLETKYQRLVSFPLGRLKPYAQERMHPKHGKSDELAHGTDSYLTSSDGDVVQYFMIIPTTHALARVLIDLDLFDSVMASPVSDIHLTTEATLARPAKWYSERLLFGELIRSSCFPEEICILICGRISMQPIKAMAEFTSSTIVPATECAASGRLTSQTGDSAVFQDVSTRIEIVKLHYSLGESVTAAFRGYKTKHGLIKGPFTVSTIARLIAKFESTGSVLDFPGKGRKSLSDERAPIVQNAVEQLQSQSTMASLSIIQVSQLTGIPRTSVHRIMRRHLHLYPYHFTLLQNITEEDKEKRVTFTNWLLDNEEIVPNILWSDEAKFSVDGIINKHNCVTWFREAPHENLTHNLHSAHLCVWMGFSSKCRLRPFFFDATVSGDSYLHMLQAPVIPQLKQHKRSSTVFQQDGAPPHYSNQLRTYLREQFSDERVIARGFPNFWPAKSPDLTPLDYWLWGMIKARVYHENKPKNLVELRARIEEECARVTLKEVKHAVSHISCRFQLVTEERGSFFESFVMTVYSQYTSIMRV
ncbi:transposable element Tc3 transposase [Clonorchis sinensis]|uniref:Transposable element Tc3 transposase n=1 Tax=Clonorchis sinensis TaxID=79923 RepID=G7YWH4_CLOSI|nr:transposable element Tc3 transposase [Clonorchis sinensis]